MEWSTLIGQFGFPVVACGAMAWYVKYITDCTRKDLLDLNTSHREAEEKITTAINNNTVVMTRLCERLSEIEKGGINESNN